MSETYIFFSELVAMGENSSGLYLRLPNLANENMEHPVKCQFQISNTSTFLVLSMSLMLHGTHIAFMYAPYNIWNIILELFIVYLKLKLIHLATLITGHHWFDSVEAEYFSQPLITYFSPTRL